MAHEYATGRWRVLYRDKRWRIVDPKGYWHDTAESLPAAHTEATRQALYDRLNEPNALRDFRLMMDSARLWEARRRYDERYTWTRGAKWLTSSTAGGTGDRR